MRPALVASALPLLWCCPALLTWFAQLSGKEIQQERRENEEVDVRIGSGINCDKDYETDEGDPDTYKCSIHFDKSGTATAARNYDARTDQQWRQRDCRMPANAEEHSWWHGLYARIIS